MERPFFLIFVKYFYSLLTLLAFFSPVSYSIWLFLPAIILMWISYAFFKVGVYKGLKFNMPIRIQSRSTSINHRKIFLLFTIVMIAFIPLYIKYYTGANALTLLLSFRSMAGSDSNYAQYQSYFAENNLAQFSMLKAPYILGYGILKYIFIFFCMYFIAYTKKARKKEYFLLFLIFFLYFLQGVSRGTSFENFELIIVTLFSLTLRYKLIYNRSFFNKRNLLYVSVLGVLGITYFVVSKSMRYAEGTDALMLRDITATLKFDRDHWIMSIVPYIGSVCMNLAGYFTFGLYYTSELFWKVLMSLDGFPISFLPWASSLIYPNMTCSNVIESVNVDTGACWQPDVSTLIFSLGIPLTYWIIYKMGFFAGRFYNYIINTRDLSYTIGLFYISYEMLSFPIGNFITSSSANQISIFITLFVIYTGWFKKLLIIK